MANNNNEQNALKILELKVDSLRMEYEQCVATYQDIYHSIWKIFSYYSTITAAFLIFSKEFFPSFKWTLIFGIASVPLVFWWLGIYTPMNKYGEYKIEYLKKIEGMLSELIGLQLCHFSGFHKLKPAGPFYSRMRDCGIKIWPPKAFFKLFKPSCFTRVKYAADLIGIICFIWLLFCIILFIIGCIKGDLSFFIDIKKEAYIPK